VATVLIARQDIKSVEALKGKTIGINSIGGGLPMVRCRLVRILKIRLKGFASPANWIGSGKKSRQL